MLTTLALDANEFEADEVERPRQPLTPTDATAFLDDPTTHLWVALADLVFTFDLEE